MKQIIIGNTRITEASSTCIDLIFTDISNVIDSGVINYNISDHLPIYLIKKKLRNKIKKIKVQGRSYLHYDKGVFNRILQTWDWDRFDLATNPEVMWDCFIKLVTKTLDILCPVKDLSVVDNKPEWLTNALLIGMRQRDKAFRTARRTNSLEDWTNARNLRNRLGMDIKTSKSK